MIFREESEAENGSEQQLLTGSNAHSSTPVNDVSYTAGARVENQPRLIDFVPTRGFVIAGVCLILVAIIALLNIAHFQILPFARQKGISAGTLELSLDRGLLAWVASFLLLATAFFCYQVYQVRRYRADDFAGRYRVWIWMALSFVIASIDATARISPIAASLIAANWESGFLANQRNVWFVLVGTPATFICIRLVLELWRSRIAIGSIAIASVAYLFANLVRMDLMPIGEGAHAVVESNSVVVAHSFLLFTTVWYARFVLLESRGNLTAEKSIEELETGLPPGSVEQSAEHDTLSMQNSSGGKKRSRVRKSETEKDSPVEELSEDATCLSFEEAAPLKLMGQSVDQGKGRKKARQRRRAA